MFLKFITGKAEGRDEYVIREVDTYHVKPESIYWKNVADDGLLYLTSFDHENEKANKGQIVHFRVAGTNKYESAFFNLCYALNSKGDTIHIL